MLVHNPQLQHRRQQPRTKQHDCRHRIRHMAQTMRHLAPDRHVDSASFRHPGSPPSLPARQSADFIGSLGAN
jgi:hypothetical protein